MFLNLQKYVNTTAIGDSLPIFVALVLRITRLGMTAMYHCSEITVFIGCILVIKWEEMVVEGFLNYRHSSSGRGFF